MTWTSIDTQSDLDSLNHSICWDDASTVQYLANFKNEPYFPGDVCRSGYANKNIHLWIDTLNASKRYLCLVLIDCDWIGPNMLEAFHLSGHMDSLKRITVLTHDGSTAIRFSRLLYRFDHVIPAIELRSDSYEDEET